MKHTDIINHFIRENKYYCYLEVGTFNREHNFNKIICKYKYCIDPNPEAKADFVGTSDEFFAQNKTGYDCIFLDGLHTAIQLYRDIINSLRVLLTGGTIIIHDLNPTTKAMQDVPRIQGEWTGDCWMAFTWLRATRTDLNMYVLDCDYGVGVIQEGKQELLNIVENITYENFEKNKKYWLNLRQYS